MPRRKKVPPIDRQAAADLLGIPPQAVSGMRERGLLRTAGYDARGRCTYHRDEAAAAAELLATVPDSLDFNAIDLETADWNRGSICQVGVVTVRGGRVTGTTHSMVNPGRSSFTNSWIHGITADQVNDAPTFRELWPGLERTLEGFPLAAHSAFDRGALQQATAMAELGAPAFAWLDTGSIARRIFRENLGSWKLDILGERLGLYVGEMHQAMTDAALCARLLVRMLELSDIPLSAWAWAQYIRANQTAEILREAGDWSIPDDIGEILLPVRRCQWRLPGCQGEDEPKPCRSCNRAVELNLACRSCSNAEYVGEASDYCSPNCENAAARPCPGCREPRKPSSFRWWQPPGNGPWERICRHCHWYRIYKECVNCGPRERGDFEPDGRTKDGLRKQCRQCRPGAEILLGTR